MSNDLIHEAVPPLRWDHQELPFQPRPGRPGRPPIVRDGTVVMDVEFETIMQEMEEPGYYRLYPVDQEGDEA